ncbi:MAG: LysR family transcriptional regulator [Pigmentiphaga sp.]|uniref:LysR family transcriptional regulator n=1 Tax=Pigmentiphaga sp. TaxID=1977564 RepID=UPI0029B1E150|nr:LysR family transcriptional regulator [Pigmentiphaga sp.]MDX3907405.1 LysR family transcriptional regulator [Pigmentiphaga sp.]
MDFQSLKTFVACVDEKSLSRCAEKLNVVASAVSKRIAELEREHGVCLLRRTGRGVAPTAAGQALYRHAKPLLTAARQLERTLASFRGDGEHHIRIAACRSVVLQYLPRAISMFRRECRGYRIDIVEAPSFEIPALLAQGEAEIGIYHAPFPAPGLHCVEYCRDRVALVVPRGHPLSGHRPVAFFDTLDYDYVGYFPRHDLANFQRLIGENLPKPISVSAQVSNPEARCMLVREGMGLALMAERLAWAYAERTGVDVIELKDAWASRQIWMACADPEALPAGAKRFFEHSAA